MCCSRQHLSHCVMMMITMFPFLIIMSFPICPIIDPITRWKVLKFCILQFVLLMALAVPIQVALFHASVKEYSIRILLFLFEINCRYVLLLKKLRIRSVIVIIESLKAFLLQPLSNLWITFYGTKSYVFWSSLTSSSSSSSSFSFPTGLWRFKSISLSFLYNLI